MKQWIRSNRELLIGGIILAAALLIAALRSPPVSPTGTPDAPPTPAQSTTLDPHIIANLTSLPQATALSGQDANQLNGLIQLVNTCSDYTSQRRDQMVQQIQYIINPAVLTTDVILALGDNPRQKLLFALVQVTKNQWMLDKSPANSCLIPIGKSLNQMLIAAGGTPEPAFEGG